MALYLGDQKVCPTVRKEDENKWVPPHDWWNIVSVYENAEPSFGKSTKRYIVLIHDIYPTTDLSKLNGDYYVTSDGYEGTGYEHTWDVSKDRPCSLGYKTRYVIIYTTNSIRQEDRKIPYLWIYFGDGYFSIGMSNSYVGNGYFRHLVAVTHSGRADVYIRDSSSYSFYKMPNLEYVSLPAKKGYNFPDFGYCSKLKYISLPDVEYGSTSSTMFYECYNLRNPYVPRSKWSAEGMVDLPYLVELDIPSGITGIGINGVRRCSNLVRISIPKTVIRFDYIGSLLNLPSLRRIDIEPGWIIPKNGFWVRTYPQGVLEFPPPNLDIDSMLDFLNKVGDNTGNPAVDITFGSNNVQRLTEAQKAIATSKNYILS